jgi:hypothetical protein
MLTKRNDAMNNRAIANRTIALANQDAGQLLLVGREHGWRFRLLGQAPMIHTHLHVGEWLLIPAEQDTSAVPETTLERISTIYQAGIRPKGFVVVHEAPKLLAAPKVTAFVEDLETGDTDGSSKVTKMLTEMATSVAKATAAIGVALPLALVAGLVLLDPILVAVTEDDYWIEIDRWWV